MGLFLNIKANTQNNNIKHVINVLVYNTVEHSKLSFCMHWSNICNMHSDNPGVGMEVGW